MGKDAVGYKKPPKNTRFQKGRSGNPGGRPKVTQTLCAALDEVLNQEVPVTVRGKEENRTLLQVIATRVVAKAAEGNLGAVAMIDKIHSRAQLATRSHEPSDGEIQVFDISMDFDEGPVQPPDMWRLCEEMEREKQGVPPQFEPNYQRAKLVLEHLRKTKDSLPDALKYLIT